MRVLEPRRQLYLSAESVGVDTGRKLRGKNLDHYLAFQLHVRRYKNARHASASQLAVDAVGGTEYFLKLALEV